MKKILSLSTNDTLEDVVFALILSIITNSLFGLVPSKLWCNLSSLIAVSCLVLIIDVIWETLLFVELEIEVVELGRDRTNEFCVFHEILIEEPVSSLSPWLVILAETDSVGLGIEIPKLIDVVSATNVDLDKETGCTWMRYLPLTI